MDNLKIQTPFTPSREPIKVPIDNERQKNHHEEEQNSKKKKEKTEHVETENKDSVKSLDHLKGNKISFLV